MTEFSTRLDEQYSRPGSYDQAELTNAQRRQRGLVERAAMTVPPLSGAYALLELARAAIAQFAPDATGDFHELLLLDFGYFAGYTHVANRCHREHHR